MKEDITFSFSTEKSELSERKIREKNPTEKQKKRISMLFFYLISSHFKRAESCLRQMRIPNIKQSRIFYLLSFFISSHCACVVINQIISKVYISNTKNTQQQIKNRLL